MHEAQEMGINVKKQWMAHLDSRTRDSHINLDHQIAEVDEPFQSDFGEIMYPGDFQAHPADVWNCRCRLKYIYPEYYKPQNTQRRAYNEDRTESELISDMTYKEWKAWKAGEKKKEPATNIFGEIIQYYDGIPDEQKTVIEDLAGEFKTKLKTVRPGAKKAAGAVQISGTVMNLSSKTESVAIHEFAHTISMENQTKFGLYQEGEFWKGIRKIRTQYRKAAGEDTTKIISTYEHSSREIDEFFAEAFAQAYMHEKGIEIPSYYGNEYFFSDQVLQLTRKFFGR